MSTKFNISKALHTIEGLGVDDYLFVRRQAKTTTYTATITGHIPGQGGSVEIRLKERQTPPNIREIQISVQNHSQHAEAVPTIRLPTIQAVSPRPTYRIYSPFRGGRDGGWGSGSSATWPGPAYSPIVTLHDGQRGDTLAITFANSKAAKMELFWLADAAAGFQWFNPFLRPQVLLQPGESIEFTVEYRIMTGGPPAHWARYRAQFLQFMTSCGYAESVARPYADRAWIAMSDWVPRGKLFANMARAKARGAAAYLQWSPPDGKAAYYEPLTSRFAWAEDAVLSADAPPLPWGVLINPHISPRVPAVETLDRDLLQPLPVFDGVHFRIDAHHPETWAYLVRHAEWLRKARVTMAFWDTGGAPEGGMSTHQWMRVLHLFRRHTINIFAETSCDIASHITDYYFEFLNEPKAGWSDYQLAKAVTPNAVLTVHDNMQPSTDAAWVQKAWSLGVVPVVKMLGEP